MIARQQNAYLDLEDRSHPLLDGLADVGRMVHGVMRVEIRTAAGLRAPLMTVPTYPDLPMEEVYQRETKTDITRRDGSPPRAPARVVYFPWDIDRTFWEVMTSKITGWFWPMQSVGPRTRSSLCASKGLACSMCRCGSRSPPLPPISSTSPTR